MSAQFIIYSTTMNKFPVCWYINYTLEWRESILLPIYKEEWEIQEYENYRRINLMSDAMKIWERLIDKGIQENLKRKKFIVCQGNELQAQCFYPDK